MTVQNGMARASFQSPVPVTKSYLHYAIAEGPWQKREWKSVTAKVEKGVITAPLPEARPLVIELAVVDERGLEVTTPHQMIDKAR